MKNSFRSRPAQIGLAAFALLNFAHAGVMAQDASRAYFANDPMGRNLVTIRSEAPLETMLTRTGAVEASIKINPQNVLDKPQARFVIDANTLDTGIALRNEHMKSEGWLDTAKYPRISFTLLKPLTPTMAAIVAPRAIPGASGKMMVEGELEFHGVKKMVTANVNVEVIGESEQSKARLDGELMHIRADFPLKLDDFGVVVPATAQLKVANEQQVHVDVFVSTGSKAPEWSAPVAEAPREAMVQTPIGQVRLKLGKTHFGIGPTF
ncbi:Polyisoprenoid-binding protein YceI [Abditibacterium utsteinense]|uniref:Polyisoprenoid-binding protein YceI n=1 Tax=Abditibacterium utsteinense TaxID=1960156 RepID=A0A2S8SSH1_9BACT|nr:YceI family protein [Abditibacterium utsteinense]PQV63726.1 Polyisoprenoid-binding protein YceI [Abditibacterium utsteinense]